MILPSDHGKAPSPKARRSLKKREVEQAKQSRVAETKSRKRSSKSKPSKRPRSLPVAAPAMPAELKQVNVNAAGIDIGATTHFVNVPQGRDPQPVRSFGAFTADLEAIAAWLAQCGVTTVAMEATGVYWIPLFELLERRGFEVRLVEPSRLKHVPGRKSDVLDCQWIQQLHTFGLLSGSFRPEDAICVLRSYVRQRQTLVRSAARCVQHMQKAKIETHLKTFQDESQGKPIESRPSQSKRSANSPVFDARKYLYTMTGVDLTEVDGLEANTVLTVVSEIGVDVSPWPTDKHFTSWLTLCPGVNKTGGRSQNTRGRTRPSSNRAATALRIAARGLLRADCALGAYAQRMRARVGAPKAITATARKLAIIIYNMLKYGKAYVARKERQRHKGGHASVSSVPRSVSPLFPPSLSSRATITNPWRSAKAMVSG